MGAALEVPSPGSVLLVPPPSLCPQTGPWGAAGQLSGSCLRPLLSSASSSRRCTLCRAFPIIKGKNQSEKQTRLSPPVCVYIRMCVYLASSLPTRLLIDFHCFRGFAAGNNAAGTAGVHIFFSFVCVCAYLSFFFFFVCVCISFLIICFHFLWIYTQKWDCWIIR